MSQCLTRLEGPYIGPPLTLQFIKEILPEARVRRASSNLVVVGKRRSRSQSHTRKVRRERGW